MTLLEAALAYEKLGWSVIPLQPTKKVLPGEEEIGKKPIVKWEAYQKRRATPKEISAWWQKWPKANIGLVTGKVSGVIAIDIDSPRGQEAYTSEFGEIHNTIRQKTGKPGGMHLLFRPMPKFEYRNFAKKIDDVDFRGDGGYIVIAPSVHVSGDKLYTWDNIDPIVDGLDDLMDVPKDVHELIIRANYDKNGTKKKNPEGWVVEQLLFGQDEGARNEIAAKMAGYYLRLFHEDQAAAEAAMSVWDEKNRPPLGHKVIRTTVQSIAKKRASENIVSITGQVQSLTEIVAPDGNQRFRIQIAGFDQTIDVPLETIVSNQKFRIEVARITKVLSPSIKKIEWETIVNTLLADSKKICLSLEETEMGQFLGAIKSTTPKTNLEAYYKNGIVVKNDRLYISMSTALSIAKAYNMKSCTPRELGKILRGLGFDNQPVTRIGSVTTRLWFLTKEAWMQHIKEEWPYKAENDETE